MGLVHFATPDQGYRPGYRYGDRIADISQNRETFSPRSNPLSGPEQFEALEDLNDASASSVGARLYSIDECSFTTPFSPGRLLCLEGCYEQDLSDEGMDPHFEEANMFTKDWPAFWCAPASAYVGPTDDVSLPSSIADIRPGMELGLVVDRSAKSLEVEEAREVIGGVVLLGHLIGHDDVPRLEGHRMFDSAFQLGTEVVPIATTDISELTLSLSVDGVEVDTRSTTDWRFTPEEMVAEASGIVPLTAGDVVLTGDPTRVPRSVEAGQTLATEGTDLLGTEARLRRDGEDE